MEENDTYSTNAEKLDSMPCNRQSNTSENHYTEIDDYVKAKPAGLAANWGYANPSNINKGHVTPKGTSSRNTTHNNFNDIKQVTYDNLRHDNLPVLPVQKMGKGKNVTFRQMSDDFGTRRNYCAGSASVDCDNRDRRFKQNSDGHYANINQDIYTQPRDLHKTPNYENNFHKNQKHENNDYAEPYGDLEISCKNEFYG